MSMRLMEEGCEAVLGAYDVGTVLAVRDGDVSREMAATALELSNLYINEENIKTCLEMLPKVADFLIREGDFDYV